MENVRLARRIAELRDRLDDIAAEEPVTVEQLRARLESAQADIVALQATLADHESRLAALEAAP